MGNYATQVWLGGNIYMVDETFSVARSLAIKDGKILYVGDEDGVNCFIGSETIIHDLKGRVIVPGFIDSHIHLQQYGNSLMPPLIRDKDKAYIITTVAESVKKTPPGHWIVSGWGWNNEIWDDPAYPTRYELDAVAPEHPVMLPRMDGHMIWVNSCALKACGIDDFVADPPGGEFRRDESGRLTGCASNAAAHMIRDRIPKNSIREQQQALLKGQEALLSYGVTSVYDMSTDAGDYDNFIALCEDNRLKLRVNCALFYPCDPKADKAMKQLYETCPLVHEPDCRVKITGMKIVADGSIGAQSAWLFADYADRPGHKGGMIVDSDIMDNAILDAYKKGLQVIIHAIGDAAIDRVLTSFEKVLSMQPRKERLFRIEHYQTVADGSLERAKRLGVIASMQPVHGPVSAGMALRRLGKERVNGAYAVGLVLEKLGMIAAGSDAPVAEPNPLDGIHSAVTRTNKNLQPEGGFCSQNQITREEALKAYTIWGAYAQREDHYKGSLEVGKAADFIVMDKDLMTVDADELLEIHIDETYINGELCWQALVR